MAKNQRISEEELAVLTARVEELTVDIQEKMKERRKLKKRLHWYNYSSQYTDGMYYKDGLCYKMFGKRRKDLTPDEVKEYQRAVTKQYRERVRRNESTK